MSARACLIIGCVFLCGAFRVYGDAGTAAQAASEAAEPVAAQEAELPAETEEEKAEEAMLRFVNEPWTGDLDGMLERGLIRALVVHSKTMYFAEMGKPRGIAYELLTSFQDHLNKKYPPSVKHIKTYVAFVPVARDELIPALLEGRGDVAVAALTITPEREEQVDFSTPFFHDVNEIVVTGPVTPELETLDDLAGRTVFVRPSSSYWEHLQRLNERFEKEGKAPVKLDPAPEELEDEDLMEMINAGLSGIIVVDDYKAELWSKVFPEVELHSDIVVNAGGEIGWMLRKRSPKLKAEVDVFAKTHGEGTAVGNTLIRRYVDSARFVKRATSPEELEKFRKLLELFRKYAGRYDLDHLLMMAQGYQESRLDQDAKSRVGARPQCLVQQRRGRGRHEDRLRDRELRLQHLQVLCRLQARPRGGRGAAGGQTGIAGGHLTAAGEDPRVCYAVSRGIRDGG